MNFSFNADNINFGGVRDSRAEYEFFVVLRERGLTRGLLLNELVLFPSWIQNDYHVHGYCVPDGQWKQLKLCYFLDGVQVHKSPAKREKDERVQCALESIGWTVYRFRYCPPISVKALVTFAQEIQKTINELSTKNLG